MPLALPDCYTTLLHSGYNPGMDKSMKSQTHLTKRGSVYRFRIRVPVDLVGQYGKKEITSSLGTKDKQEATGKARLLSLKYHQEFSHYRNLLAADPVQELSQLEIDRLAALYLSHLLEEDEEHRQEGLTDREYLSLQEAYDIVGDHEQHHLGRGRLDEILMDEMDDFLESQGLKVERKTDQYRKLGFAFLKASKKATDMMKARHRGDWVDTPKAEPVVIRGAIPSAKDDTLAGLVDYWKTQGERRTKTLRDLETVVKRFGAVVGDVPASKITKRHVVDFKDKLLAEGKSRATVRKYLALLGGVFNTAFKNERIPANPVAGVELPKVGDEKNRTAFDADDLQKIFTSPVFKNGDRPTGGKGEAAHWLPLLALFTGARLEELGQLLVADVKEEDNIRYIHIIDDKDTGKKLKTRESRRRVPIHAELIRLGFLRYVETMRQEKQARLFPLLKSNRGRQVTESWSKWWGRYLRKTVGITDTRKVFHSFRHTFKDACRASGVQGEINDRLTGHASGNSVANSYGADHYPLEPLADGMARLRYKGLDLSHLGG